MYIARSREIKPLYQWRFGFRLDTAIVVGNARMCLTGERRTSVALSRAAEVCAVLCASPCECACECACGKVCGLAHAEQRWVPIPHGVERHHAARGCVD